MMQAEWILNVRNLESYMGPEILSSTQEAENKFPFQVKENLCKTKGVTIIICSMSIVLESLAMLSQQLYFIYNLCLIVF